MNVELLPIETNPFEMFQRDEHNNRQQRGTGELSTLSMAGGLIRNAFVETRFLAS